MEAQNQLLTLRQKELQRTLLVPLIEAINSMEVKGVNVDVNRLALMYAQAIPVAESISKELSEKYNLNPASPLQVKHYFKIDKTDRTELESLIKRGHTESELIQQILDYRDLTKGAGTFLKGVYERLINNRIHTQYNIEGTGTGRLSSENPNLQNVPKPFRVIYTPDTSDDILISGDFKQLELWVVALLGPCPPLLEILKSGQDIHGLVDAAVRPYLPERLQEKHRMIAKSLVFGTGYGLSARTIAITHSVPVDTAKTWQNIYLDVAGLNQYFSDRREDFTKRGYTDTPFGRRRYITSYPQALNAPVQSTASDVTLTQLNKCYYEAKLDLRLQVHDEIVIHSSKKDVVKNARKLKEVMESYIPEVNNSFPVEIKTGENWYEMEVMKL
jgi:DNA polymerase-1